MDTEFSERLSRIENHMAIERLRHTYWLAIVERDLETMLSCYTDDSHSEFGFGFDLKGADATRAFYADLFAREELKVQVPFGTNGIIDMVDEDKANGSWLIQVSIINHGKDHGARSHVRYRETYRKVSDAWKIAYQKTEYLFFEKIDLLDSPI